MPVLPVVPSFFTGDSDLSKLQELSYAVAFLVDCDVRPAFHIFKSSGGQTFSTAVWTTLTGGKIAYDSDNIFGGVASFTAAIQTPGYYTFEGCAGFLTGATGITLRISFLLTAGANNPNLVTGTTIRFGTRGGSSTATASNDTAMTASAVAPSVLYPGDTVAFQARASASVDISPNNNASYISGRFVPSFTGYMIRAAIGLGGVASTSNLLDQSYGAILDQASGNITT